MNGTLLFGALSLMPAAALWVAWPRRSWAAAAAWACVAAAGGLWLVGLPLVDTSLRLPWCAAGAACLGACLYSVFLVGRNAGEYERVASALEARRKTSADTAANLAAARTRAKDVEVEQREVLALYGMVKAMAEVMTWDDIRPRLETAIEQYLRLDEFAVFVVESKAQDNLRLLARRRLSGSPGSSWETLQRWLQENSVPLAVPRIVEKPERAVALPVFEGERLMGYFYARLPKGVDAEALLAKAQTFVDEVSFAFRRIKLFQEVEKFSQVDGLTGAFRRGVLDERLSEEVVRAQTFKT
ncbi:MAG: hypothetical protein KGL53_04570, partial [Elusimicrobia bacterium]|nr:hypothetical protein [Elusimicrobiota bacterium]